MPTKSNRDDWVQPVRMAPPDKPITTQAVIGIPDDVEDGLIQIAKYTSDHAVREGKFEFYLGGVLVRVTLTDKAITRSWPDAALR